MVRKTVSRKKESEYEEAIIIAIAIFLVLGLILVVAGLRGVIFGQSEDVKNMKTQIIENLDSVDQKVDELNTLLKKTAG